MEEPGQASGHHVKATLERDVVTFKWICAEPAEAQCHLYCKCEETAPQPGEDGICERCETPIRQLDYCNLVTWFEEGGTAEEQYGGDPLVVLNAEIEAVWEGDYYTWKVKP